jgi:hypothetical protein
MRIPKPKTHQQHLPPIYAGVAFISEIKESKNYYFMPINNFAYNTGLGDAILIKVL